MLAEDHPWVHAVDVLCYEFGAPGKRAHDSIVIALRMLDFAGAHPSSEQISIRGSEKRLKTLADCRQVILKLSPLKIKQADCFRKSVAFVRRNHLCFEAIPCS